MGIDSLPTIMTATNGEKYLLESIIGNGSFGIVIYGHKVDDPSVIVAVKRVLQDSRFQVEFIDYYFLESRRKDSFSC